MFRINALGGLSLTSDGGSVVGAPAQPRRLAVLALLARAGERGITREKIIAILWPDADEDRARRLLTQAVYTLRRDLGGEEVLLGFKDLRLNRGMVESDVGEFEAALRDGAWERAARLYEGPFLDGFHLPSAPDFERWAEVERGALAHDYEEALGRLARSAAEQGDATGAVGWWKRLAAHDPLNARHAAGLMRALAEAGDRVGALRHAQIYEALVEQELELPPDREVTALAEQLRATATPQNGPPTSRAGVVPVTTTAAPAPGTAAIPVPVPVVELVTTPAVAPVGDRGSVPVRAAERVPSRRAAAPRRARSAIALGACAILLALVAVGFAVWRRRGAQADGAPPRVAIGRITDYRARRESELARPIADMLATNLARVPGLRILSTARMYELVQLGGGVDSAAGTVVGAARRGGATELVEGALYGMPDGRLRLDVRRVDVATGNVLSAVTVAGPDAFALVDSGTSRLVAAYGARAPAGSVADVTTSSLAAYRLYEEGLRDYYRGDARGAVRLFTAALREDSTFAMATFYAAQAMSALDDPRGEAYVYRAVRLADQASDRERLSILAWWAQARSSPSLSALAETLATRYPDEIEGHLYRATSLVQSGRFLDALPSYERVVAMDSAAFTHGRARCMACDALTGATNAYMLADSLGAAERTVRRMFRFMPDASGPWYMLGAVLDARGRTSEASAALAEAARRDPATLISPIGLTSHALYSGDFDGGEEALRAIIRSDVPTRRGDARWSLAILLRHAGRLDDALAVAREHRTRLAADAAAPPTHREAVFAAIPEAQVRFERGEYRAAAALSDTIAREILVGSSDTAFIGRLRAWHDTHAATALAAAGDTGSLRRMLDTVRVYGARSGFGRDPLLFHHVQGLLLVAAHRDAEAIGEFRAAIFSPGFGFTRTNYELGRALLRLGRPTEAVAVLAPALRGGIESANLYITHTDLHEAIGQAWDAVAASRRGAAAAAARDSAVAHYRRVALAWRRADPMFAARRAAVERRLLALGAH